jgi:cysteine-rich repeat protein
VIIAGCGGGTAGEDAGAAEDARTDRDTGTAADTGGDGVVGSDEDCDDGNDVAFDGCEPDTCLFTCQSDSLCVDPNPCNGTETCSGTTHACEPGAPLDDGDACEVDGIDDGVCRTAICVSAGCGNSVLDGAEACDDGNTSSGDGCENDCTFTCTTDEDCATADVCDGSETCDVATHTCETTGPLDCDDESPCTSDSCHTVDGCVNALIDGDGDGHASTTLGACGDDCEDDDATSFAGAPELCEAAAPFIDNDCDPSTPNPSASLWYIDCVEDSFSTTTAASTMSCEVPAAQGGCGWTSRVPVTGDPSTVDCNDANASMFPGQTAYFTSPHACSGCSGDDRFASYDCNEVVNRQVASTPFNVSTTASCRVSNLLGRLSCSGSDGWTSTTEPACGYTGTYTSCGGEPEECRSTPLDCDRRGYEPVCVGADRLPSDPCYCPRTFPPEACEPDCIPGERDCPWRYLRCARTTVSRTLGCR